MPTLSVFFLVDKLALLLEARDGLRRELTATPLVHLLLVLHCEVRVDGVDEALKGLPVLRLHLAEGDAARRREADDLAEAGLRLDDAVRDVELAAEGREPDDDLDRVDVVRDDNELRLLRLDERRDVLDAVGEGLATTDLSRGERLLSLLGGGLEPRLVLLLGLRAILLEELEDLDGGRLVERVVELVHGRRDLEPLHEDATLPLDADILRPLDAGGGVSGDLGSLVGEQELLLLDVGVENDLLGRGCAACARHGKADHNRRRNGYIVV